MDGPNFDDLAKRLSTTTSRREAVRLLGGALATGALGALLPGRALAAGAGGCADFCNQVFGKDTVATTQCIQDAKRGMGLCSTCGPASLGGTQPICCTRNASGYCTSYTSAACCASGQTCEDGTCAGCANPASDLCSAVAGSCGANGCQCVQSVDGGSYCASQLTCNSCSTNTDCVAQLGSGHVCVFNGGCICTTTPGGLCVPVSPATTCVFHCFTGETLIAMADGTSRPIEHIRVGDLVLGNAGRVNRVTEVHLPLLGQRPLYALNGSAFFVTSGHPFMTEEGWKAVDPAAVPAQLAGLHVGRLAVGDRLLRLTAVAAPVGAGRASGGEAVDVRIEGSALQSLIGQPADPATQLYNLRLDGDHTYFANDLLVHNK